MKNEIVILERPIRQKDGLYCLNDLHKASGGLRKHEPKNWLYLNQTNELIEELSFEKSTTGISVVNNNQQVIQTINGGHNRGTYACRELVYAYATWISPRFFLLVLRTFEAAVSGSPLPPAPPANVLRVLQSAPLRPPRDLAEAERLADEAVLLESRLNHIRRWLAYWREVWLDEYGYLHLPRR